MPASSHVLQLSSLPNLGVQLVRAAVVKKRHPDPDVGHFEASVRHVTADARHLTRYREVCGFESTGFLPPTFPQVIALPLHLAILNHPAFPYGLFGMIHVRNVIRQHRRLPDGAALSVRCWMDGQREVRAGREMDLFTRVEVDGALAWEASTTMLRRMAPSGGERPKAERGAAAPAENVALFQDARPSTWTVPADTGRRYARASGDYNPIHLHPLTARPFGFDRPIAHGMWTLARCAAEMGEAAEVSQLTLTCDFRRPLFLPGRVRFQTARDGNDVAFRVTSEEGKAHVTGRLEPRIAPTPGL